MIDHRTQYNKMPKLSDLDEESDTDSLIVYLKAFDLIIVILFYDKF